MYLKIFSNCKLVKGYKNYLLYDIQRGDIINLPDDLYEWLIKFNNKKIDQINDPIMQDYIDFLKKEDFIFFTENPTYFPEVNLDFDIPCKISNVVIDINDTSYFDYFKLIDQIDYLNCDTIEIRFFKKSEKIFITDLVNYLNQNKMFITNIGVVTPFCEKTDYEKLVQLNRMSHIQVYNSPNNDVVKFSENKYIIYSKQFVAAKNNCGIIDYNYFTLNKNLYLESLHHNSCLHKKISIDSEGNIRNCPSMSQSFGNIKDTTLEEALDHKDFKKYWNLTKDKIEVCKDCEFRYICTDCRAYTERTHENKEGLDISKPLKCGYNPYTGEWEEWSTNPLKEKAIKYYGMQELVKKN